MERFVDMKKLKKLIVSGSDTLYIFCDKAWQNDLLIVVMKKLVRKVFCKVYKINDKSVDTGYIYECDGRIIRCLTNNKKPPVGVDILKCLEK